MAADEQGRPAEESAAEEFEGQEWPHHRQPEHVEDRRPGLSDQIVAIDVRVIYRHPSGEMREAMIDTSRVLGLTWDHSVHESELPSGDEVKNHPAFRPHLKWPPRRLGRCDDEEGERMMLRSHRRKGACCWWNGREWICPDEIE